MAHAVMAAASSPSPVPSEVFALVAFLALSLAVLLILRYYLPLRTTPAFYLVPIFLALWLPAGIVLLVPIDLASSVAAANGNQDGHGAAGATARGVWLPQGVLLAAWKVMYWLTFALTWLILPVLAEYADSGYREPRDKLIASLRANAQYHVAVFGAGLVGLVYVFVSYGVSLHALKGLVMALAYSWGLALAIYLMGHGLVALPRRLLRGASPASRLRRLQTRAPRLHEQMEDAFLNLEDVEAEVAILSRRRRVGSARDLRDWIEELAEMANLPEAHGNAPRAAAAAAATSAVATAEGALPTVLTEKYLAELTRKLVRARHSRSRHVAEWGRLVDEASRIQRLLDSAPSRRLEREPAPSRHESATSWSRITLLTPHMRWLLHYHAIPYARIGLGIVLAIGSAMIVWSELVRDLFPGLSAVRLSVAAAPTGLGAQVAAALWILYMCAAALGSVAEVRVWRGRALVYRNTAHESAFWYASQVARLTIPLAYNFMTLMSPDTYTRTTFYQFLGQLVGLTPLGSLFDALFPVFVLVPVGAALFGLYGRASRFFGLGGGADIMDDDDGDYFGSDNDLVGFGPGSSWREGRDLIERELGGTSTTVRRREEAFARLAEATSRRRNRARPTLTIPPAAPPPGGGGAGGEVPLSPLAASQAATPRPSRSNPGRPVPSAAEDEDEDFLAVLGHRMRNTIDSIEPPRWLQEMGQGIKKPAWMGGGQDGDQAGDRGSGSDIRRWFGGEGRIRI